MEVPSGCKPHERRTIMQLAMKPERDVMQTSPISAELILDQLNKILSSSLFANADQSRALLKFVVEEK